MSNCTLFPTETYYVQIESAYQAIAKLPPWRQEISLDRVAVFFNLTKSSFRRGFRLWLVTEQGGKG